MEENQSVKIKVEIDGNNATDIIRSLIDKGFSVDAKSDERWWTITGNKKKAKIILAKDIFNNTALRRCFSNYLAKYLNRIIDGIAETQSIEPTIEITSEMIENGIKEY